MNERKRGENEKDEVGNIRISVELRQGTQSDQRPPHRSAKFSTSLLLGSCIAQQKATALKLLDSAISVSI